MDISASWFCRFCTLKPSSSTKKEKKKRRRIDCKVGLMVDKSLASNWWEKQGQITVVHVHYGLFVCQYGRQTSSTTELEWLMTA